MNTHKHTHTPSLSVCFAQHIHEEQFIQALAYAILNMLRRKLQHQSGTNNNNTL